MVDMFSHNRVQLVFAKIMQTERNQACLNC